MMNIILTGPLKQAGRILEAGTRLDLPEAKALKLIEMGYAEASSPEELLTRIKALLALGPIPYDQVLLQTGASEDEIREAIRTWYGLISGKIQGKGEEFYWWIDPVADKFEEVD